MTWRAPRPRTKPALAPLHTPVTSAPARTASCTAKQPTPPPAPSTATRSPSPTPAIRTASDAVVADTGRAAAVVKGTSTGRRTRASASATAYWAKVPRAWPTTRSPGRHAVTPGPTASMVPAKSQPGMGHFGPRKPYIRRTMWGSPSIRCQMLGSTPAADTRTRTWRSVGSGTGKRPRAIWVRGP